MTVVATINPGFTGSMHNDATVTSSTPDPDTSDNTATVTTSVGASADLSVTVVDSPDPVLAGRTVTWTINVVNQGPSTATVVELLDLLPDEVTFASAEATSGSAACVHVTIPDDPPSHQVECDLGTIAPGAAPTTVVVKAVVKSGTSPGAILNTATVSSATTDPDGSDDSALATTQVNTSADLRMALTSDKDVYKASATIVYTATVTNAGPSDAQPPRVTVDLPPIKAAVYVFDTAGCTKTGQQLVCVADGDGGDCAVNRTTPTTVFHTFYGMSPQRSTSSGDWATWSNITPPVPSGEGSSFYPPFEASATNGDTIAMAGNALYVSRNNGTAWTRLGYPSGGGATGLFIPNADTVLVGMSDGRILRTTWSGYGVERAGRADDTAVGCGRQ